MAGKVQNNTSNVSLVSKYLKDICSNEEAQRVVSFMENPENDKELKVEFGSQWANQNFNESDFTSEDKRMLDQILDRIQHKIRLEEENNPAKQNTYKKFITLFSRAAAVLILPLLLYSIYATIQVTNTQTVEKKELVWQTVKTPAGMQTDFLLPDGSHVWLNSGSVFKYPVSFASDIRQVELSGEAFFDVVKDAAHPFLVQAGKMNIEVKGTRFDVISYPAETKTELILESGLVNLFSGNYADNHSIATVEPGHIALLDNESNKLTVSEVDVNKYTAWKEGKLIFKDDRMDEVVAKLNRWFNIDIQLKSPELNEYVYTATYQDETLNQILELLTISAPIKYTISERERQPDNTYSKRKIVLTKRKI